MISESRADKALEFLVETDKEAAILKGQMLMKEQLCRVARAKAFRSCEGSVESRKAWAEVSAEVTIAEKELAEATVEFETVRNRRNTAEIIVGMYRTEEASRRQGGM